MLANFFFGKKGDKAEAKDSKSAKDDKTDKEPKKEKHVEIPKDRPLLFLEVQQARRLKEKGAQALVTVDKIYAETEPFTKGDSPVWNKKFIFEIKDEDSSIDIDVTVGKKKSLGTFTYPLNKMRNEIPLFKWYPLQNGVGGDILLKALFCLSDRGKMQLLQDKLQVTFYQDLEDFFKSLAPETYALLFDHYKCVPSGREIEAIVHILITCPELNAKTVIKFVVDTEVSQAEGVATLFRRNSLATKMIGGCMTTYGQKYLKELLGPFIDKMIKEKISLEVDPSRTGSEEIAAQNMKVLNDVLADLIERILSALDKIPIEIRQIATLLYDGIVQKYESAARVAIGGLIFLRFICPAVTSPAMYGISFDAIDEKVKRTLILITKVLQNLANGILFEMKEKFMVGANEFLEKYMDPVGEYFLKIPIRDNEFKVKKEKDTSDVSFIKAISVSTDDVQDLWAYYVVHLYFRQNLKIITNEDQSGRKNTLPINDKPAFKSALETLEKILERLDTPVDLAIDESLIKKQVKEEHFTY
jgi:hypothetical protein